MYNNSSPCVIAKWRGGQNPSSLIGLKQFCIYCQNASKYPVLHALSTYHSLSCSLSLSYPPLLHPTQVHVTGYTESNTPHTTIVNGLTNRITNMAASIQTTGTMRVQVVSYMSEQLRYSPLNLPGLSLTKYRRNTTLKGACLFFSPIFENLFEIWYQKESLYFSHTTHEEFYCWNMFPLEDMNENVANYGNHNLT